MKRNNLTLMLVLFFFAASGAHSQSVGSVPGTRFASYDGAYFVEIPFKSRSGGGGSLQGAEAEGLGRSYFNFWKTDGIELEAAYARWTKEERQVPAKVLKARFENTVWALRERMIESGFTVALERPLEIFGFIARELEFESPRTHVIYRMFAAPDRLVRLRAEFPNPAGREQSLSFLNSLRLDSRRNIVAWKIAEATPADLPQQPALLRPTSDLIERGLKGRVASVIVEKQELKDGRLSARKSKFETSYDRAGNLRKEVEYDYEGHPDSVIVFGFLDGMRVSRYGRVANEQVIAGPMLAGPVRPPNLPDPRFSNRYEYRYDEADRVREKIVYRNNGEIWRRSTFAYNAGQTIVVTAGSDGVPSESVEQSVDSKGNVVGETLARLDDHPNENRYRYDNIVLDRRGNWIKRSVSRDFFEDGKVKFSWTSIEYRRIRYWP